MEKVPNKGSVSPAVSFRRFDPGDYTMYREFCVRTFGEYSYQKRKRYVDWLYGDYSKGFAIAVTDYRIVGIEHNFKAPILINNTPKLSTVLHDLMVDDNYKGSVGFRLMYESLRFDRYLVLPGSIGRLSRTYGRLGSTKFESFWYRKFQIPTGVFKKISEYKWVQLTALAERQSLLFGHNKEDGVNFMEKALKPFQKFKYFPEYLDWRFFHKDAPLTFYLSDFNGENTVLFTIGKRGRIPFARIFYIRQQDESTYKKIVKLVHRISARLGVPVILHSSFESPPPERLGYVVYKDAPVSYVYTQSREESFSPMVPTFCSDIGFDGLDLFMDA